MSECVPELLFEGPIAEEYRVLARICPEAADIGRRVGELVGAWRSPDLSGAAELLEIGCGTGLSTAQILRRLPAARIVGIDNSPDMLKQASVNLADALSAGRLRLVEIDALSYLQTLPAERLDIVASVYTLHNFMDGYRERVLQEIYRVLKPGGLFVNGDRYARDDAQEQLRLIQAEARGYCRIFADMQRPDLLEEWVVHLLGDESPDRVMRLGPTLQRLERAGFRNVEPHFRQGVNALVGATKPARRA